MSRIGKQTITVPSGVDVTIANGHVTVKGPKGQLEYELVGGVGIERDGDLITVTREDDSRTNRSLHGLQRTLINNMVVGVSEGFVKELEIVGVGYRAAGARPERDRARARVLAPGARRRTRRHHVRGAAADSHRRARVRQAARRSGRGRHPQDPQARAVQGQGRPLCRRAHRAQGRKVREVGPHGAHQARTSSPPAPPGAQEGDGHSRTAASRRVPFEQAHLCAGHRRHRGPYGRERVDHGSGSEGQRHRDRRIGQEGRQERGRPFEGSRYQHRRVRPRRIPVPRPGGRGRRRRREAGLEF